LDGKLWPVEVKHAATVRREWAGSFAALMRLGKPMGAGAFICQTTKALPIAEEITALPVGSV
jgi:hypothetical protein